MQGDAEAASKQSLLDTLPLDEVLRNEQEVVLYCIVQGHELQMCNEQSQQTSRLLDLP